VRTDTVSAEIHHCAKRQTVISQSARRHFNDQ